MEKYIKYEDRGVLYDDVVNDLSLQKTRESYTDEPGGSYFIEFSSKALLIRYVNDRYGNESELKISVASISAPSKWLSLPWVINFIENKDEINTDTGYDLKSIMYLNNCLKLHFDKIAELLNANNYKRTFAQIEKLVIQESMRQNP